MEMAWTWQYILYDVSFFYDYQVYNNFINIPYGSFQFKIYVILGSFLRKTCQLFTGVTRSLAPEGARSEERIRQATFFDHFRTATECLCNTNL